MKTLQFVTFTRSVRTEHMDGSDYIVAPVVAIVSGVLNGELVPIGEIANGYQSWNGRPVTIDHPQYNGMFVTANDPLTWEQYVVGKLFHVSFDEDRLKGEIWVDVQAAEKHPNGIELLTKLNDGAQIEVSTAYFRELDPLAGEWRGIPYQGVATDLKPDHLAILLHSTGACSWADGCGVRINESEVRAVMPYANEHAARLKDPGQFDEFRRDNDKFGEGIDAIWGIKTNGETHAELQAIRFDKEKFTPDEAKEWLSEHDYDPIEFEPAANQTDSEPETNQTYSWWERFVKGVRDSLFGAQEDVSLEEQWDAVVDAFYKLIESGQPIGEIGDGYVVKVYPENIIVERADGRLFSVAYSTGEAGIEFGEQTEVRMTYTPVGNESADGETGSETDTQTEEPTVNEPVDDPESEVNEGGNEEPETESGQDLEANETDETEEPTDEGTVQDEAEPEPTTEPEPAANLTVCEKYRALVEFAESHGGPEWALESLAETVQANAKKRNQQVEALLQAPGCAFNKADLQALSDSTLEKLWLTLSAPKANYGGQPAPVKPKTAAESRTINLPPMRG